MKKSGKRFLTILPLTLAMLLTTACGGAKNESSQSTAEAVTKESAPVVEEGQTMTVLLSEEPSDEDSLGKMLKLWEEETGNIIDMQIISYDDQLTKFPSMAKNNDLPDLIVTTRLHRLYPEEFLDMSEYFDLSIFEDSAVKIIGKDYTLDKITGLPLQFSTTCLFYNETAFEKANIEVPATDKPWTWDELYQYAEKLQSEGGVKYGFAADVSRARYDILMYANGGSLTVADGDTFKVNVNCAQNVDTLQKFVEANKTVMPQALWSGATSDNPADYFKNGDVGIYLSGSWNYNSFATDITNFEFGVMPSPKGTAGQSAIIGGSGLAIPENASHRDLAISFLEWLYTPENFQKYLQSDKGLSSLRDVIYQPETEKAISDFEVMQAEASYVTDTFMVDENSSWRTYKDNEYRDYIKRAVAGELTAQEALDAFAKELSESSGWKINN